MRVVYSRVAGGCVTKVQTNVRLEPELLQELDELVEEIASKVTLRVTRSDVVRFALRRAMPELRDNHKLLLD